MARSDSEKGKKAKKYAKAIFEALSQHYLNPSKNNCLAQKVQVKKVDSYLIVTGEIDSQNSIKGTKLEYLRQLIQDKNCELKDPTLDNVRNGFKYLQNSDKSIIEPVNGGKNEVYVNKRRGILQFKINEAKYNEKFTTPSSNSDDKKPARDADDKNQSTNEKTYTRKLQDILNLLRSFDCQEQMELITTNKHGGIFYTEVDQPSRNWFLWRLAKHIKKINNAKIIKIISSKYNPIYKFDYIREEIARAINLKELKYCNDEMLVQQLSDFFKTKTVVLIVDCDKLNNKEFQLLTCLCNKLWKSGKKVNSKLFLFMFLVVKKHSNSKCNQLDKKLEMKEIDQNELEQWFTESENIYKYYAWDKQQEIINDYCQIADRTAYTLIYTICTEIFKLKNEEFEAVEQNWKTIQN